MCQLLAVHGAGLWVPLCSRPWVPCLQHALWVWALLLRPGLSNRVLWTWQLWQPDLSVWSWLQRQPLWKSGLSRYFSFTLIFSSQKRTCQIISLLKHAWIKKKARFKVNNSEKRCPDFVIIVYNGKKRLSFVLLSFFDWGMINDYDHARDLIDIQLWLFLHLSTVISFPTWLSFNRWARLFRLGPLCTKEQHCHLCVFPRICWRQLLRPGLSGTVQWEWGMPCPHRCLCPPL